MDSLRAVVRSLLKQRIFQPLHNFESRLSFFTPSDWFIVATIGIVMALAAGTLLAGVSVALTDEVPARGGTYIEGVAGTPRFVNPLLAISDTDRDLTALVYSGLLKANPDGSLSPDLASSYDISKDQRTYTFTLKDTARFHDGAQVTAEDVAFTVRQAQNPDVKSPARANWEGVDVTIIDPKTVSFTLKTPYAPFLQNTTLGILPKHLWQGVTAEQFPFSTLNANPVGSGPYTVANVKRNSSGIPTEYDLVAFTRGTRTPFIANFIFKFYADVDVLKNAFNQGAVSAAYGIAPSSISAAHLVNEAIFGRVFGVFFNQNQNKIFSEEPVRRALDIAVDKNALVSTILKGYGSAIDGPLPPEGIGISAANAGSKEERIASARAVLVKAGWKAGTDGVFEKTVTVNKKKQTERLAFSLSTSNMSELKSAAELAADDWKALGADVALQFFDQNDLTIDVLRPRKYDALLFGLVVGRESDLYPFWHSSQRNDPGLNIALYANANVDKALEAARTEDDPLARREKVKTAAKTIASETAAVFLYTPHFVYLSPPSAQGIVLGTIETPSDRFISVDEWYLMTERLWPVFTMNWHSVFNNLFNHI
ncbi:hypothetical protein HY090_02450 [Candidatus Kaiserbacteria bacterium]|nr:hypothetical protein [Candidatus Kaiserbacteria bacterium]